MLAKQGVVCAIAHTTCCICINTSGEVEIHLEKISQKVKWLQDVRQTDPLNDLFSYLPSGIDNFFCFAL